MKTPSSIRITLPRIYTNIPLEAGTLVDLPENAVRHIQVLRMQPGQQITLFNSQRAAPQNIDIGNVDATASGIGQWLATIVAIGRRHVQVHIDTFEPVDREPAVAVSLLIGIPANERMDFLIEKATELGVNAIYPLIFERSVIKLNTERSAKKRDHWQAIAIAACEQCGGNRIPSIHPVMHFQELFHTSSPSHTNILATLPTDRRLLSLNNAYTWPITASLTPSTCATSKELAILSGPEGGLSLAEEQQLIEQAQFTPYRLSHRTLRADTAPLAALSSIILYNP